MITKDFFPEAESGTARVKQIRDTLINAGYRKLGSGADATVWTKDDSGPVVKILMPEAQTITQAERIFKTFVDFCIDNQDNPCLPKFYSVNGQYYSFFQIGKRYYIQYLMEKLYPIPRNSTEEALVYLFEDFVKDPLYRNKNHWNAMIKRLSEPEAWENSIFKSKKNQIARDLKNTSIEQKLQYRLLFVTMQYLYDIGGINNFGWDLNTRNIMMRKDGTLVIVDPWYLQYQ